MLGRMQVDRAPAEAIQSFQTLRKGVDEGFFNTLGLAAAGLDEARAAFNLKQYDRAIELYEAMGSGSGRTFSASIHRRVIQATLKDRMPTSCHSQRWKPPERWSPLLSQRIVQADSELQPDAFVAFNRWLKALESSNLPSDPLVEPRHCATDGASSTSVPAIALAPTESLNRAWLASECAFREGDLEKA